jgi:hypothetical protein
VKSACHAIAQQGFRGPCLVRDTGRHSGTIQFLSGMRLRASNYLRPRRTSREAILTLRHMARRPLSHEDWGRWRTPEHTPEVDRVPCFGRGTASTHVVHISYTLSRDTTIRYDIG